MLSWLSLGPAAFWPTQFTALMSWATAHLLTGAVRVS
jgi:hypothetical protein